MTNPTLYPITAAFKAWTDNQRFEGTTTMQDLINKGAALVGTDFLGLETTVKDLHRPQDLNSVGRALASILGEYEHGSVDVSDLGATLEQVATVYRHMLSRAAGRTINTDDLPADPQYFDIAADAILSLQYEL